MNHVKKIHAACLVVLLATSAWAGVEPNLPPMNVWISPDSPAAADYVEITLSGNWPDPCVPEQIVVTVSSGESLWLDLLLPGWEDAGSSCCPPPPTPDPTPWELEGVAGVLVAGHYHIFARVISCEGKGLYSWIGEFQVGDVKPDETPRDGCGATGYFPGSRVVLLEDSPPGGSGLKTGQSGTVICNESRSDCDRVLISWDLWTEGGDDTDECLAEAPLGFPADSTLWVNVQKVLVGRQFLRYGTLRACADGCICFHADRGGIFNVVATGDMQKMLAEIASMDMGRVCLRGLLNKTRPGPDMVRICPQRDGDVFHPIVSACPAPPPYTPGVCDLSLQPGDRVVLLVDNPMGAGDKPAVGLLSGATGTVVCTDSTDDKLPFYVSWDGWTHGTDTDYFCDSAVVPYIPGSGWWMACHEVDLLHSYVIVAP